MSLESTIKELKSVAAEAEELFDAFKDLVGNDVDQEIDEEQKKAFEKLIAKLETKADEGYRAWRDDQIKNLEKSVRRSERVLAGGMNLSESTRETIESRLMTKRARLARLSGDAATDFGGILTTEEAVELEVVIEEARKEVQRKKKLAAFLSSLDKIVDTALSLAGKLIL